jgi:hypothetical protein
MSVNAKCGEYVERRAIGLGSFRWHERARRCTRSLIFGFTVR